MIKLKRYTEDNLEIFSLEIARFIKVSILGSNIKGQHVSLDITVWRIGVSIGLNFWKLEIK